MALHFDLWVLYRKLTNSIDIRLLDYKSTTLVRYLTRGRWERRMWCSQLKGAENVQLGGTVVQLDGTENMQLDGTAMQLDGSVQQLKTNGTIALGTGTALDTRN